MVQSTVALIILALFLGCAAWLIFLWAVRRGEFEDVEEPKFRMLDDNDGPDSGASPTHDSINNDEGREDFKL